MTVISVVRFYYVYKVFFDIKDDSSYSLGFTLSIVESNVAIIAASVPALWPLARRWWPKMDEKLGVNLPHHADIEVQVETLGTHDDAPPTSPPPRVHLRWSRFNRTPPGEGPVLGRYVGSPTSAIGRASPTAGPLNFIEERDGKLRWSPGTHVERA